ncbi:MAG: cation diffusion facilitator family transporter [Elusimicrobiota bacterium]|nr:cation diffusion facilitator family transporter [Elusimicrobiota bacterium]MDH5662327.1 cation diffusion facilitator family transporter [Elusimicrobiota bacterium]
MIKERCLICSRRVEWVILGINLSLFLIKGIFTFISNSRSLFADTLESLANVVITVIVLFSLKIAEKECDGKFPYGYGKVEFLASGIVNLLLLCGAIYFIFVALGQLGLTGPEKPPRLIAIFAATVSILGNWGAFAYGRCVGEKVGSVSILANAWVSYADVATSAAVIIAVVGANLGIVKLDHIVSVIIALIIVKMTGEGIRKAIKGLMDSSSRFEESKITNLIKNVRGIKQIRNVKTRQVGRKIWVDLKIAISGNCPLKEGLKISQCIKSVLHKRMGNIAEVSIQLVPTKG